MHGRAVTSAPNRERRLCTAQEFRCNNISPEMLRLLLNFKENVRAQKVPTEGEASKIEA